MCHLLYSNDMSSEQSTSHVAHMSVNEILLASLTVNFVKGHIHYQNTVSVLFQFNIKTLGSLALN